MTQGRPTRGYVICSEHRSGSTLLCQLLASTGQLGRPDEFFRYSEDSVRLERDPSLLNEIVSRAATANGVYGLKVFSQQFDVTSKSNWPERLPGLRFVHLDRRDLLGQAISLVRALQTGQYFSHQPRSAEPRYDGKAIARHLARIADGQARWRRYFARNGIDVLSLVYEEVVADPAAAAHAVARHVGIDGPIAIDSSRLDVERQRDVHTQEWRSRFIAEAGDLNYLDHHHGRARIWLRRLARDAWYFRHKRSGGA